MDNSPFLPWPPPAPTRMGDVSRHFEIGTNLAFVDGQLRRRFASHGYEELRYFAVPGGFGVTTPLERLQVNGEPAADRWQLGKKGGWTNLFTYLGSLIQGEDTTFRLFAILVTNEEIHPATFEATEADVSRWKLSGMPALSARRGRLAVARGTRVWLLVYEFAPGRSRGSQIVANKEGRFSFRQHAMSLGLQ